MPEIVFNSPQPANSLQSQIDNLQTTLASLNQQVISLQEALQERDQEIARLKNVSAMKTSSVQPEKKDETLTLIGALVKLYKFILQPSPTWSQPRKVD